MIKDIWYIFPGKYFFLNLNILGKQIEIKLQFIVNWKVFREAFIINYKEVLVKGKNHKLPKLISEFLHRGKGIQSSKYTFTFKMLRITRNLVTFSNVANHEHFIWNESFLINSFPIFFSNKVPLIRDIWKVTKLGVIRNILKVNVELVSLGEDNRGMF